MTPVEAVALDFGGYAVTRRVSQSALQVPDLMRRPAGRVAVHMVPGARTAAGKAGS